MDLVYKAQMLTQGGRSGTLRSEDGSVNIKLAVPAAMGGKGDGPNPEQLFAGVRTLASRRTRPLPVSRRCRRA